MKQVILVRQDIQMPKGKLATQVAHASVEAVLGSSKEKLPQIFSTGFVYRPIEKFSICADYQKELRYDASPRFGFEYWMIEEVAVRGGVSNEPSLFTGGFGVRYLLFQVDYAFSSHQELGGTHQVSISIRWGESEE